MGCCGTLYYCTADGPVTVEPDEDGWYDPPEGWTAGPFGTEAEAADCCPPPPFLLCDDEVSLPGGGLYVSVSDQTMPDDPLAPEPPFGENSYLLDTFTELTSPPSPSDGVILQPTVASESFYTQHFYFLVRVLCAAPTCGEGEVQVGLFIVGGTGGYYTLISASADGWELQGGWLVKCVPAEELSFPLDLGTVEFDIYLGSIPPETVGPFSAGIIIHA